MKLQIAVTRPRRDMLVFRGVNIFLSNWSNWAKICKNTKLSYLHQKQCPELKLGCLKIKDLKMSMTEMLEMVCSQGKTNGLTVPNCGTYSSYLSLLGGNMDMQNCHTWRLLFKTVGAHCAFPKSAHSHPVHPSRMM